MKKSFKKILTVLLTLSMLFSVCAVGINAASGTINNIITIYLDVSASPNYWGSYGSGTVFTATVTPSGYPVTWTMSSNPYANMTTSGNTAYVTSTQVTEVTLTASIVINGQTVVSDSCTATVSPSYSSNYPWWGGNYPWGGIIDPGFTYPPIYGENVVYVDGVPYWYCGNSYCTNAWCIHRLTGYGTDYSYCSSSCNWCGNPLNHTHWGWDWDYGWNRPVTKPEKETTKLPSAIDRLKEYRENQGKTTTEETTTTETSKPATRWYNKYSDIDAKSWFYDAVRFVDIYGYMEGISNKEFGINSAVTRGEFAEVLGKFADVTASKYTANFEDVSSGASYAPYAAWAVEKGFMTETSKGYFSPNEPITREEAIAAIYSYVLTLKVDTTVTDSTVKSYKDFETIGDENVDAIDWALSSGILSISGKTIDPEGTLVKARLAQMLYTLADVLD